MTERDQIIRDLTASVASLEAQLTAAKAELDEARERCVVWERGRIDAVDRLDKVRIEREQVKLRLATMCRLAKQATNGWASFARSKREHDDITRLHSEIDALSHSPAKTEE